MERAVLRAEAQSPGFVGQPEIIEMDPVVHSQPLELDMYGAYVDFDFSSTVLDEFLTVNASGSVLTCCSYCS